MSVLIQRHVTRVHVSPSRFHSRLFSLSSVNHASESSRPPAPTVEKFDGTSKPRPYIHSSMRKSPRDLPAIQTRWPIYLAAGVVGIGGWTVFLFFVSNQEKVTSSVVKQIMYTVRENPELRDLLGEAIRPEPIWYLNGEPLINGKINQVQGNIDLSFRIKGHKGAGTLYFTSIRKAKGEQYQILRFRVIGDDGTVTNIPSIS